MTEVTIVRDGRERTLVQWSDDTGTLQRNWVKTGDITQRVGKRAQVTNPGKGQPYGVDFSYIFQPQITGSDLNRELRRHGLWTAADIQANPNIVVGVLQAVYRMDFAKLTNAAIQHENTTED